MRAINGCYLGDGVVVRGDVVLAAGVNIWFGSVLAATGAHHPGAAVNIQDGCIVHTDYDRPQIIEEGVVVGHRAVLHGRSIGADTLHRHGCPAAVGLSNRGGMCDRRRHAGHGKTPDSAALPGNGMPGKVVREVTDDDLRRTTP